MRGWENTALGTLLGVPKPSRDDPQSTVETVPLNHEQREAVREATTSPLTVVTGPPGTGKSQIIVSMIADSYVRGRTVLFTSKNNKAVDVVETRVSELSNTPLMVRTGGKWRNRDFRQELFNRLMTMMSLRPTDDDRQEYERLKSLYAELCRQEQELWDELQTIRSVHHRLIALDKAQANFEPEFTREIWTRLRKLERTPSVRHLKVALQLTVKHLEGDRGIFRRFSLLLSNRRDREQIHGVAEIATGICPVLGSCPEANQPFQAWRTWMTRAISVAEALEAITQYKDGLAAMHKKRSRDEVARQLRRIRTSLTDTGARLISLYGRLAPIRLGQGDRQSLGDFAALHERLANDQLGGRAYATLRNEMARLFPKVAQNIPTWCVTNLSAQRSFELEPGLFDLLIIDEASQCDIASALPLLYRSKRAVIIGDAQQLRHVARIERRRDQQLQASYGMSKAEDQKFAYSTRSLFELSVGATDKLIQLRDHYRSHHRITDFSNRHWYQNSLRVWTNHQQLKTPSNGTNGIRWTEVNGQATRPRNGSLYVSAEADVVVRQVVDLLVTRGFDGSAGVVTPFRAQANMIRERVAQQVPAAARDRAQLVVDTAHGFQGDERDVIFLSPCLARPMPSSSVMFLRNTGNLFNVAITRARSLLHVVGSKEACIQSGVLHLEQFASYCAEIENAESSPYETVHVSDDSIGPWERPLYEALVDRGLNPMPQYAVNQYRLDLAIVSGDTRIDIEADGESTHLGSQTDVERDIQLESLGWRVVRFWNRQIRDDIDYCVQTVVNLLNGCGGPHMRER